MMKRTNVSRMTAVLLLLAGCGSHHNGDTGGGDSGSPLNAGGGASSSGGDGAGSSSGPGSSGASSSGGSGAGSSGGVVEIGDGAPPADTFPPFDGGTVLLA